MATTGEALLGACPTLQGPSPCNAPTAMPLLPWMQLMLCCQVCVCGHTCLGSRGSCSSGFSRGLSVKGNPNYLHFTPRSITPGTRPKAAAQPQRPHCSYSRSRALLLLLRTGFGLSFATLLYAKVICAPTLSLSHTHTLFGRALSCLVPSLCGFPLLSPL